MQVPTTLLAQVDSSVGGKVGINLPSAKNMVGAFWQPRGVVIDVNVLATLPEREFRAGMAEVVKYGVIQDAEFFAYLEKNVAKINGRDAGVLTHIVERCCQLKADVVEQDEREETGVRAILNYGHTFCHAFEAATGYGQLLHGEGRGDRNAVRVAAGRANGPRRCSLHQAAIRFAASLRPADGGARGVARRADRADVSRQESRARQAAIRVAFADGPRGSGPRRRD